jgi:hypothetical protein
MKRRAIITLVTALAAMLASCADERPTGTPAELRQGELRLYFVDSFHINDSTTNLVGNVRYGLNHQYGFFNNGIFEIGSTSQVGQIHQLSLAEMPSGRYTIRYETERPFVILGRKDDTGEARFLDATSVTVIGNTYVEADPVEIWAYRLNRLVVYFETNILAPQADTIIEAAGAEILTRTPSIVDGGLFYRISTLPAGNELELKRELELVPGVRNVLFDIFGQSYF